MKFNDNFSNCNKYRLLAMDIFSKTRQEFLMILLDFSIRRTTLLPIS